MQLYRVAHDSRSFFYVLRFVTALLWLVYPRIAFSYAFTVIPHCVTAGYVHRDTLHGYSYCPRSLAGCVCSRCTTFTARTHPFLVSVDSFCVPRWVYTLDSLVTRYTVTRLTPVCALLLLRFGCSVCGVLALRFRLRLHTLLICSATLHRGSTRSRLPHSFRGYVYVFTPFLFGSRGC